MSLAHREAVVLLSVPDLCARDGFEITRLPVTVVCGFVGAGKSALVQKVVAGWTSGRLAVLVHDRSDAGLDADLCRSLGVEVFRLGEVLAELIQQCVGCSLRDSLASAITAIADMQRFDRVLVECSGLVEPVLVAEVFNDAWENREPLASKVRLDHLVTVVDGLTLWDDLHSEDDLQTRGVSCGTDDGWTVSELVVEQMEYATVLVISKTEGLSLGKKTRLRCLLETLNPEATILSIAEGLDVGRQIVNERTPASMPISFQPGWAKLIQGAPMPTIRSSYWAMRAFRATRPFHPQRLWELIESDWPGILRCRGYFWIASQPDRCFLWSQTASGRFYECIGDWWASIPCADWPDDKAFRKELNQDWSLEFGDRRQALACIGYRLDQERLFQRLASCLLTTAESKLGLEGWRRLEDPFAQADLEIDLQEDERESEQGREDGYG